MGSFNILCQRVLEDVQQQDDVVQNLSFFFLGYMMGFHINIVLHNTQNTNILKLHHIKGGTNKKFNVIQKLYIIDFAIIF
jgi:uncharacterized membrane protein